MTQSHQTSGSKTPIMTPQMLTLGLDSRDTDTDAASTSAAAHMHDESRELPQQLQGKNGKESRTWWKNVKSRLGGSPRSDASQSGENNDDDFHNSALDNNNTIEDSDNDHNSQFYTSMDQDIERPGLFQKASKAQYTSLENAANSFEKDEQGLKNNQKQMLKRNHQQQQYQSIHHPEASQESLLQQAEQESSAEDNSSQQHSLSREEALERDCSFFYRNMSNNDTNQHQQHRKNKRITKYRPRTASWRVMVRDNNSMAGLSQPSFEYSAAVDVLTPPVLQRYRAKFAQLNQEIQWQPHPRRSSNGDTINTAAGSNRENDLDVYDLQLTTVTSDGLLHQDHIVQTDTVETSSLFFHLADKTVMRLPRDQVRLMMDQDLEAGILSVEQWREPEELPDETWKTRHNLRLEKLQKPFEERHPALRFVLTVEDNLYRKIVEEMSDHLTEPFLSPRRCCLEDKKVDIRVAILILVIVLLVLFLTTIEWPTE